MAWRRSVIASLVVTLVAACTVTPSPVPQTSGPSIVPESARPTATPSPTAEAVATATQPEASPAFPTMPPYPGPASLAVGGQRIAPSHVGGCWLPFYGGEQVIGESCGPDPFDLDAASTLIKPAAALSFTAPAGWSFSSESLTEVAPTSAWQVTIAPVSSLERLPTDRQETIYLAASGQVLGASDDTAATIGVTAPTKPGEYLLELRAFVSRDDWTWGAINHHWRITIR